MRNLAPRRVGNPGQPGKGDSGANKSSRAVISRNVAAGRLRVKIKAGRFGKRTKRIRRELKRGDGRAKVKIFVTYTPAGGISDTKPRKLKLVRK